MAVLDGQEFGFASSNNGFKVFCVILNVNRTHGWNVNERLQERKPSIGGFSFQSQVVVVHIVDDMVEDDACSGECCWVPGIICNDAQDIIHIAAESDGVRMKTDALERQEVCDRCHE